MKNKFDIDKIEAYILGELSEEEQSVFEQKISVNKELAREVKIYTMLIKGISVDLLRSYEQEVISKSPKRHINNVLEDIDVETQPEDDLDNLFEKGFAIQSVNETRDTVSKYAAKLNAESFFDDVFNEIEAEGKTSKSQKRLWLIIVGIMLLLALTITYIMINSQQSAQEKNTSLIETPELNNTPTIQKDSTKATTLDSTSVSSKYSENKTKNTFTTQNDSSSTNYIDNNTEEVPNEVLNDSLSQDENPNKDLEEMLFASLKNSNKTPPKTINNLIEGIRAFENSNYYEASTLLFKNKEFLIDSLPIYSELSLYLGISNYNEEYYWSTITEFDKINIQKLSKEQQSQFYKYSILTYYKLDKIAEAKKLLDIAVIKGLISSEEQELFEKKLTEVNSENLLPQNKGDSSSFANSSQDENTLIILDFNFDEIKINYWPDWNHKDVEIQITVESTFPLSVLKKLKKANRYKIDENITTDKLSLTAPNLDKQVMVHGRKLEEKIILSISVPPYTTLNGNILEKNIDFVARGGNNNQNYLSKIKQLPTILKSTLSSDINLKVKKSDIIIDGVPLKRK